MNTATANSVTGETFFDNTNTRERSNYRSTALVRVNGVHDEFTRQRIIADIEKMDGILTAKFLRETPAMLEISYIPGQQELVNVLRMVRSSGNHASRVC